jgi:hypothetical protein
LTFDPVRSNKRHRRVVCDIVIFLRKEITDLQFKKYKLILFLLITSQIMVKIEKLYIDDENKWHKIFTTTAVRKCINVKI